MGGQVMERALIVGSAQFASQKNLWRYPVRDAYVIAADGGRHTAEQLGLSIDWYIGDGDSGGSSEGASLDSSVSSGGMNSAGSFAYHASELSLRNRSDIAFIVSSLTMDLPHCLQ